LETRIAIRTGAAESIEYIRGWVYTEAGKKFSSRRLRQRFRWVNTNNKNRRIKMQTEAPDEKFSCPLGGGTAHSSKQRSPPPSALVQAAYMWPSTDWVSGTLKSNRLITLVLINRGAGGGKPTSQTVASDTNAANDAC
jgi:hypothetical protein